MGRRLAEPAQGRHRGADRRGGDRLGAVHVHHELALHASQPHGALRAGEPICFFFPVQRALLDQVKPAIVPMDADPGLVEQFQDWSRSRDDFQKRMKSEPPPAPPTSGRSTITRASTCAERRRGSRTRLRQALEASAILAAEPAVSQNQLLAKAATEPSGSGPAALSESATAPALRKRDWLLHTWRSGAISRRSREDRAARRPEPAGVPRKILRRQRPVILAGEMQDWPALAKWTPE